MKIDVYIPALKDGCRRDKDGYYWITGRVDDVIIVSGHNVGTAEIESAFVAHPKVAEAAVVGYPHDIKGNGLYCYVTLNAGEQPDGDLERSSATAPDGDFGRKFLFDSLPPSRSRDFERRRGLGAGISPSREFRFFKGGRSTLKSSKMTGGWGTLHTSSLPTVH